MSGKRALKPFQLLSSRSLGSSFTSAGTSIRYLDNVAIQLEVTTSSNTGTFTIEATSDPVAETSEANAAWCDLGVSPAMTLANANTEFVIAIKDCPFDRLRVKFVVAGGTPSGTVNAYISAKSTGG